MKTKLLLLFTICLACLAATAQEKNTEKEYKWGVGLSLNSIDRYTPLMNLNYGIDNTFFELGDRKNNSFAIGLMADYFINSSNTFRIKTGLANNHFSEHMDRVGANRSIDDVDYKQKIINFSPGISWNTRIKEFVFFGGFEITSLLYGALNGQANSVMQDTVTSSIISQISSTGTVKGGFGIGPGVFSGFKIQATKKILIGGEFSFALLYRKLGGDIYSEGIITVPVYQTISTVTQQTIRDFAFPRLMGSINIFYLF